ncbi:DUF2778 domain-containing protein [Paraburkholderia acidisoli]|uniref:DUF2778 domain-containing protein n=1 Tax=Paraburkholderia acidisoli TaxID=2571748 RepID=A0A7Z2JH38_9BURK|nr:DUF2778 domain-containing protein [Paraburkholderia acidisoli]QGZ62840.1 DUF2778 domain-containing protein [Paraburkholderia acidisoli]
MTLSARFVVNDEPISRLVVDGVGAFPAFSGDDIYRNRSGCTAVANLGPLPAGKYWIVQRPEGGAGSRTAAWLKDTWNSLMGAPTNHAEWFALYRDDGVIDDWTWISGVRRGQFRLHPSGGGGHSFGCVTLQSRADFNRLRQALLQTTTALAGGSGIRAFGWIEVISNGKKTCP